MPPESTVVLSFKSFDLEKSFDFVKVYKEETTETEPVANYTSNEIPYETIMKKSFLIVFTTSFGWIQKSPNYFLYVWETSNTPDRR